MRSLHYTNGNHITLLRGNTEYFPALETAINKAHSRIYIETYIFAHDNIGILIIEALKRAAKRGVMVHLLLDGFGSQDFPQEIVKEMLNANIQVLIFRQEISPFRLSRNRLRRMHRKLAVIDGDIAFIGGINIIDDPRSPKLLSPRLDFAISIVGPLQFEIYLAAKHLWMLVAWARFKKRWTDDPPMLYQTRKSLSNQRGALLIRDNFHHRHDIEEAYLDAITKASSEIIIANAYFLPGTNFRRALNNAAKRGVNVTLLLQGITEHPLQYYATHALYDNLLSAGIKIYEYNHSYLHAKVAVIDRCWSTVGSSNIDPFSLLLAREANVVVVDKSFATELQMTLTHLIDHEAVEVFREKWKKKSWFSRIVNWASYYIIRILWSLVGYNQENNNANSKK
ncbi:cardiolipin synthase B [Nitrosomonadaceae bacterium]|nr:cardiolipin synthase ClsB [Nitrosospira sp.]MDW7643367.1 cardiolipin synthase ClsB [Nitrosomonadaceae bacterium]MDW7652653.1 cardiolipin synthase ClsB [Nitrosomonadaceae bacterium]MDW7664301.1 cardiolipin synthase ClsB [Nitrosomonadaceae bacterium]MDW7664796.1 cardiolipin synthase ClsB [Nitrosomonadaceae bacterium]